MNSRRVIEITVLGAFVLVLLGGVAFNIKTSRALATGVRFFEHEIGLWGASQQEREVLRLRDLVGRLALGDRIGAEEYALQRDLMISRIALTSESIRNDPSLFNEEKEQSARIEQLLAEYQRIEGGALPAPATARQLAPIVASMASYSHDFINSRREAAHVHNVETKDSIEQLQLANLSLLLLLGLAGAALFWVNRRTLATDLAAAYAEARQRATDLEVSQIQLAGANEEFERQNIALIQALAELESAAQARAQLESTVQHLGFPIIPVLEGVLVLPLVGALDRDRLTQAGQRLCETIIRERAAVAIIDITGVVTVDAAVVREVMQIAQSMTLLGCRPMLVGITPAVAEELVQLDFRANSLITQSTLQQAVTLALRTRALTPAIHH